MWVGIGFPVTLGLKWEIAILHFWHKIWWNESFVRSSFPRLFAVAADPNALVSSCGSWLGVAWVWAILWRRQLFTWEEELLEELLLSLELVTLSTVPNLWVWTPFCFGMFLVASIYHFFSHPSSHGLRFYDKVLGNLNQIRKSVTPSKVVSFSWQFLLERVPI